MCWDRDLFFGVFLDKNVNCTLIFCRTPQNSVKPTEDRNKTEKGQKFR